MNVPKLRFKDNNDNDYPQWNHSFFYDTFKFLSTNSYSRNDMNTINGTIKNIHYGDILTKFNHIIDTEKDILPYLNDNIIVKNLLNYTIQSGDIVIADTAEDYTTGKTCEIINSNNQLIVAGLHTMLCRPKQNIFTVGFLGYFMNSNIYHNQLLPLITGIKVYSIIKKEIIKTQISIPCIEEQKKIANFLTTVDKKITNLENTITSLENQKKGLLQQIFSQKLRFKDKNGNNYPNWEKKKLGDIGSFSRGGNLSKSDLSKKGTSCILYGELYTYYNEFATEIKSKTLNTTNLVLSKKYDVLLPLSGETAEDISTCTCIFFDDIALGSDLLIFRSSFFDGRFMSLLLKYKYKYKIAQIAQGKSIVHISEKNIKNINIKIPCIEEQQNIADFILIFTKKLENQKAQLEHWKQIKKGLLQQMFV